MDMSGGGGDAKGCNRQKRKKGDPDEENNFCSPPWKPSRGSVKVKKLKIQKRALEERLFACTSPTKKKLAFQPCPPDDSTCDDSTLMDLLGLRPLPAEGLRSSHLDLSMLVSSPSKVNFAVQSSSPEPPPWRFQRNVATASTLSPLKTFSAEVRERDGISSPRRLPLSPSSQSSLGRKSGGEFPPACDRNPDKEWQMELCLDWSLKSGLNIISPNYYGWSSTELKTSEESSGVSAFVRCADIEPSGTSARSSQLDTSLGAQFHQCCLYWQHPSIPTVCLFPREPNNKSATGQKPTNQKPSIRLEKATVDSMHSEWMEAFRSAFHLVKARQCPFFYVCLNNMTCLFCSAGTQGQDHTAIYVTPTTISFRKALNEQKIQYSFPNVTRESSEDSTVGLTSEGSMTEGSESDEEDNEDKEVGKSARKKRSVPTTKNLPNLISISGSDTLSFFNFLINSKSILISNVGPYAGLPPTILSPVAFHGATLKSLQVEQCKLSVDSMVLHSIEMLGPILPHVMHMLTSLLNKTVKSYKIKVKTLESTVPLNLNSTMNQNEGRVKPSAFDLQNLSDCGLKRGILEVFCRCDNCATISQMLEGKRGMYRWQ